MKLSHDLDLSKQWRKTTKQTFDPKQTFCLSFLQLRRVSTAAPFTSTAMEEAVQDHIQTFSP
jgi:hypothetical protein